MTLSAPPAIGQTSAWSTPRITMSLSGAYDTDNVFAKILRGEIPNVTVFEDERVLAFMDVFPQSEGHVLVIS